MLVLFVSNVWKILVDKFAVEVLGLVGEAVVVRLLVDEYLPVEFDPFRVIEQTGGNAVCTAFLVQHIKMAATPSAEGSFCPVRRGIARYVICTLD